MNGIEQERLLARRIVQRMGETGQPPERGALRVNVGTDVFLEALKREYLEPIRAVGLNSTFKLIQGPFGGGKSHFLRCFREIAWQEGFATSLVNVSPRECPFTDMQQIYRRVAETVELPPGDDVAEPVQGIDAVLRQIVEARAEATDEPTLFEWLRNEAAHARVESHAWRRAAFLYMEAVLARQTQRTELLGDWLRGTRVPSSEVQRLGVREDLEPSTAFRWLRSLVQLFRVLDIPGIVLMFDEMDRTLSLPRRQRREIGDNLRQLIDSCGQSILPSAVCLYAVPPEFMTNVVPEYPALEQRLRGPTTFSDVCPTAPIIDLDRVPLAPEEMLRAIGKKLFGLYTIAHPEAALDEATQDANLLALARQIGGSQLEIGSRRTFVRAAVALLAEQHRAGQRILDEEEIRRLAGLSAELPPAPEGEEVF